VLPGGGVPKIDSQERGPTRPRMLRMPKNGTATTTQVAQHSMRHHHWRHFIVVRVKGENNYIRRGWKGEISIKLT